MSQTITMNDALRRDVERNLEDMEFVLKGKYWQRGRCPSCNKREMFVEADAPWMLKCGRENNCGAQYHIKELWPELFNTWSERYGQPGTSTTGEPAQPVSATQVADAYLSIGRGFDLEKIAGWYSQEIYHDSTIDAVSATVRFPLLDGYWQRLIDKPERFGKKKAHIKYGMSYAGQWWQPPGSDLAAAKEIWITEGIFDSIALLHHDIDTASAISCSNYPGEALEELAKACAERQLPRPALVFALDAGKGGERAMMRHVRRAREAGWEASAATTGNPKRDWNDCHQRGELTHKDIEQYRFNGQLLLAEQPTEKALLLYKQRERREFWFEHRHQLYWFKLDLAKYEEALKGLGYDRDERPGQELEEAHRDAALRQAGIVTQLANCYPRVLYYLENKLTDESWYYWSVAYPHDGPAIKKPFTAAQQASSSRFKERLMSFPGAIWKGNQNQLDTLLQAQITNIKTVETIDWIGYSDTHATWVFGDIAVRQGKVYQQNAEDYFEMGRLSLKTLAQSPALRINHDLHQYRTDWATKIWQAYGERGVVALAFWLGALFAEQIRDRQDSYPFLEIIGEPGSGKSTLIEFLWRLMGRQDYEGFDPSKASLPARARNFAQVANLPVVLIESDRDIEASKTRQFDWDELKTAYNGRSVRARGVKNNANDTYEPPFRGAIVISQNAPVNASDAIMQRIIHLRTTREHHTDQTKGLAEQLARIPTEHLSGFAVAATTREAELMAIYEQRFARYEPHLANLPEIRVGRIAKNHAQIMALVDCLGNEGLGLLPKNAIEQTKDTITTLAIERQQAINTDHPVVQEFWESYDFLTASHDASCFLNHYRVDASEIAINLKHFEKVCAANKLRVPDLAELKRHLKGSKARKFIESNRAVRSNLFDGKTIKCWIFQREQ